MTPTDEHKRIAREWLQSIKMEHGLASDLESLATLLASSERTGMMRAAGILDERAKIYANSIGDIGMEDIIAAAAIRAACDDGGER